MKINLEIEYRALWGESVCICGSIPELGAWNEEKALTLSCISHLQWNIHFESKTSTTMEYYFFVKKNGQILNREYGTPHSIHLQAEKNFTIRNAWQDRPEQDYLYTSAFTESFNANPNVKKDIVYLKNTLLLKVKCPYVKKNQMLILCGETSALGGWNWEKALTLENRSYAIWEIAIDASKIKIPHQYKLAIYDKTTKQIEHFEIGENRWLKPLNSRLRSETVSVEELTYSHEWLNWKAAGVAIPVFSLRSQDSFGVGEFSDIKKLIDWAVATGQKIIQTLPVNDTTITHTWTDSYPYNAISIYALHPLYLGLTQFPLTDTVKLEAYKKQAKSLNGLKELDYDKVTALKHAYLKDLFEEKGSETLKSKPFIQFLKTNEEWLFPYACYTYLRDKYHSADYRTWTEFSKYNKKELEARLKSDVDLKTVLESCYFTQYLLHVQLLEIKEYAHKNGVILKGDIPIGISSNSVDAWIEPHLFNLDTQTGAPPDDFSVFGQNWGFPTYNWDEMAKDGYQWWIKRFRKMSDYFDAYRIDHILGFFRIWEIPLDSVQGLLGYFSPALPFTVGEINNWGLWFDEYRMTKPYIHEHFLSDFFGEYTQEVVDKYLNTISWQRFELKEFCDTQQKIKALFEGKNDEHSSLLRAGLYALCNEVLFVRDKRSPHQYHPRITAQFTYSFRDLDHGAKEAYNRLYDHFFYHRHNQYWKDQAMQKLPALISSTKMLVCGEDLGMIPDCVSSVMNDLHILSLEIQRMPKETNKLFENLTTIPYNCVCTTSTHDMSPIRTWWEEDRAVAQQYYNRILWKHGEAPQLCTAELCWQILINHLHAPAMLTILPLQDWLSMDEKLRRPNPQEERINIPAVSQHYWRYRMHITLEDLLKEKEFNKRMKQMVIDAAR